MSSLPDPFRVAKVDGEDFRVLDVGGIEYGTINPLGTRLRAPNFSESECIADPLTSIGTNTPGIPGSLAALLLAKTC